MKRRIFYLGILLAISTASYSQSLTKVWTTTDGLKTPESALYDDATKSIYVTNIDGNHSEKDGNGFVSVLNTDGKMKNLQWVTGLNAPKGQAISNGNLYVADIDELVVISIKEAKITNRYKVENAKFLNDVTASDDGIVFVSDMKDHKIYALQAGKLTLWLDDTQLENVNGLWTEKGQLYAGNAQILQIDIKTKSIKALVENCGGIDGLEKLKDGNFIYSNWQGRIFITKGNESIKLLDTVDKQNTADIDFVHDKNLVLVPTFSGNSLEAYSLK
jgi:DNA-binding beta-propeller fold protein YncE